MCTSSDIGLCSVRSPLKNCSRASRTTSDLLWPRFLASRFSWALNLGGNLREKVFIAGTPGITKPVLMGQTGGLPAVHSLVRAKLGREQALGRRQDFGREVGFEIGEECPGSPIAVWLVQDLL